MKPDISVVVPAFNEELSIPAFAQAAKRFLATVDFHVQFVFVDDGSSDATFEMLKSLSFEGADAKIVKLSRNFGSHAAIRAGIAQSDSDHVAIYSMDMPEPIEDITLFQHELDQGTELVYSVRKGYRGSLGSRLFSKMVKKYIEQSYPAEGLIGVAFGPKIKAQMNQQAEKNSSVFFQLFKLGFKRKGIEVNYAERQNGESKWTLRKKVKLFADSFVMFSFTPIRLISLFGVLLAVAGLLWALGIVICKVFDIIEFAAGWPTMMSVILVGFGVTNISLGILAEYLVRDLDASRSAPAFLIDEVIENEREL